MEGFIEQLNTLTWADITFVRGADWESEYMSHGLLILPLILYQFGNIRSHVTKSASIYTEDTQIRGIYTLIAVLL